MYNLNHVTSVPDSDEPSPVHVGPVSHETLNEFEDNVLENESSSDCDTEYYHDSSTECSEFSDFDSPSKLGMCKF